MTRDQLIAHQSFLYRVIEASEGLLRAASEKTKDGRLWAYFEQHLQEESGHAEMMKADLIRLGVTEISRYHAAAQLAGSQYYLIAHENPALLLGYMHMLESNAPSVEAVLALEREHNVELTCMQHHAMHDVGHAAELVRQIARQPSEIQALIAWNEQNCAMLLRGVFEDMSK